MRPELKAKLDQESKRDNRGWLIAVLITILAVFLYALIFMPISSKNVQGEVITLTAIQTEVGSLPRLRVELENGHIVHAKMTRNQAYVAGATVTLEVRKTIAGLTRYRVLTYE